MLLLSLPNLIFTAKLIVPAFVFYILGLAIYNRYFHPLRHYPGPFWASITNLWYFRHVRYGLKDSQLPIHKEYGLFVRTGPNRVAISDPAAIEVIYAPKNGRVFQKAEFYDGFNPKIGGRVDGFSERNEERHTERRRIVAPLYTQGAVLSYEPCVDRVIDLFYNRMELFATSGEVIDLSVWIRKYTFDVIGEIFYGRPGGFGMIRDDIDYNGWCKSMDLMPNFGASVTYVPYGLRSLFMASQLFSKDGRDGLAGFFGVIKQAKAATQERLDMMVEGKNYNRNDMLSKLIEIVETKGKEVGFSMLDVTTEIWAIIWAGSDTTAIALTAIFYCLHKHPNTLEKLRKEIEDAFVSGALNYPIRFNDAIKLPYLHAVVKESMRMHPSLGTGLPRLVPPEGAEVCGHWFPGGSEVIMNQNAVHFDKSIYGEDSEDFNPERWLQDEQAAAKMDRYMLQFGQGPRICIGRYITWTEMYKVLPTVLRDFKFELTTPEWTVWHGWFQQQKNVMVKVSRLRPKETRPQLVKQ